MSDKPFALSTILPAEPAEPDYDALCSAVMATPRGRWFLDEYARRNRNSDTSQVLSAIERIAAAVAGQHEHHANQEVRIELLEMARTIARTRAEVAENGPHHAAAQPDGALPDIGGSAERLRDIAWTMRACGVELSTSEQIEQIAETILAASALREPGGQQAQKLGEVLLYLEHRIDRMLDSHMEAASLPEEAEPQSPSSQVDGGHNDEPQRAVADPLPPSDIPQQFTPEREPDVTDGIEPAPVVADETPAPSVEPAELHEMAAIPPTVESEHSAPPVAAVADSGDEPPPHTVHDLQELLRERVEFELAPPVIVSPVPPPVDDASPTPEPHTELNTAVSAVAPVASPPQTDAPSDERDGVLDDLEFGEAEAADSSQSPAGVAENSATEFTAIELEPIVVVAPPAEEPSSALPPDAATSDPQADAQPHLETARANPSTLDHALDAELAVWPATAELHENGVDAGFVDAQASDYRSVELLAGETVLLGTPPEAAAQPILDPVDFSAIDAHPTAADREPGAPEPNLHDHRSAPDAFADLLRPPEAPTGQSPAAVVHGPIAADVVVIPDDSEWTKWHPPQLDAEPEATADVAPVVKPDESAPAADAQPSVETAVASPPAEVVALQVEEDLQALTELFSDAGDAIARSTAAPAEPPPAARPSESPAPPAPEPPPENDVLSSAWETAVVQPAVHAAAVKRSEPSPVPTMWGPPARAEIRKDEDPADFLFEPTPPIQPAPARVVTPGIDAQAEIEAELFNLRPGAMAVPAAPSQPTAAVAIPEATPAPRVIAPPLPSTPASSRAPARPMPRHSADDPLAALTAMSEEERIALFT